MKLLVSIVWTLVLAGSVHSLTSQERTALANLMHHWPSLTDPSVVTHPWNNSFDQACNYFSDEPVWDGWSGLFCNSHGSVAQLALNGLPLGNTFPQYLTQFPDLKIINLYAANLNGTLPSWISQFPALEELYIGINNLNGQIPNELSAMLHLRRLSIDHNQFSGLLPQMPSSLAYFWAVSNNLQLCPTNPLPQNLSSCDVTKQGPVSCGQDCSSTWSRCQHDEMPGVCSPTGLQPPASDVIPCPLPQPAPGFECDTDSGVWESHEPITTDLVTLSGPAEAYSPLTASKFKFIFKSNLGPVPELTLHDCWYHTAPIIEIQIDPTVDASKMKGRVITIIQINRPHSPCPNIANWQVHVIKQSSCVSVEAKTFDSERATDLHKLVVSFSTKRCKTWLWILLGVLLFICLCAIIVILISKKLRNRICPCLAKGRPDGFELLHSESRDTVY